MKLDHGVKDQKSRNDCGNGFVTWNAEATKYLSSCMNTELEKEVKKGLRILSNSEDQRK